VWKHLDQPPYSRLQTFFKCRLSQTPPQLHLYLLLPETPLWELNFFFSALYERYTPTVKRDGHWLLYQEYISCFNTLSNFIACKKWKRRQQTYGAIPFISSAYLLTLAYYAFPRWYEFGERRWNDIDRGNRKTRRKTCPSATLSTTNPTWIDPGANPGLRGERPPTNDLSRGTVSSAYLLVYVCCSGKRVASQ
jgi:hypothetical protein